MWTEDCPISPEDLAELVRVLERVDQADADVEEGGGEAEVYAARLSLLGVLLRHHAVIDSLLRFMELHMDHRFYVICAEIFGIRRNVAVFKSSDGCSCFEI
jgi:hypothetical protein